MQSAVAAAMLLLPLLAVLPAASTRPRRPSSVRPGQRRDSSHRPAASGAAAAPWPAQVRCCAAAAWRSFSLSYKKLMPELRLHCHANSAGYWSVRRAHANRTECHGKTSGLQPTPQHTTVMHGTIRPQTPFRVPPLWRTPLVSCGHRTCRLPTSTTQACRCAAITHGGEARGP